MTDQGDNAQKSKLNYKNLFASLRLKDTLDVSLELMCQASGSNKAAILLADNDSLSLKLMNATGYSDASLEQLKVLPFSAESILKKVVQSRSFGFLEQFVQAPDISAAIMLREKSTSQIGLPLIASNLLVGALLIDLPKQNKSLPQLAEELQELADGVAIAVSNSILYGRSEFERERLNTLYKTSCALSSSVLRVAEVLQIAADTALILGGTEHCAVLMPDPNGQSFHITASKGLESASLEDFDISLEGSLPGRSFSKQRTEYVHDTSTFPVSLPRAEDGSSFGSAVALPVVHQSEVLAVIMLFAVDSRAFQREQIELLETLTSQVSTALNVALTHESTASQSIQDAHTGLYNRWHFDDSLGKELERSTRHKRSMAVLLVDVDHLSHINHHFGPEKGDEAIKHVAQIIKSTLRDIDIPCRYDGDSFAIILPETAIEPAQDVAERLRQNIRNSTTPGIGMVTVSIGMATYPTNGNDPTELIKSLEQALDIAKFEGRDRLKVSQGNLPLSGPISWEELANQAKLAVVNERQQRQQFRTIVNSEYAPWLRNAPNWVTRKKNP
jgi:diguanylate cyclase (GGDEF)-like protein